MKGNHPSKSLGFLNKISDMMHPADARLDQIKKSIHADLEVLKRQSNSKHLAIHLYQSAEEGFAKDLDELGIERKEKNRLLMEFRSRWETMSMNNKSKEILNSPEFSAINGFIGKIENLPKLQRAIQTAKPKTGLQALLGKLGLPKAILSALPSLLSLFGLDFLTKKKNKKKEEKKVDNKKIKEKTVKKVEKKESETGKKEVVPPQDSETIKKRKDLNKEANNYLSQLKENPYISVSKIPGNAGRNTLVYVPPQTDLSKNVKIIYHFHGKGGENFYHHKKEKGKNAFEQAISATNRLQNEGQNVILVYPLSTDSQKKEKSPYNTTWMSGKDGNFKKFNKNTQSLLQKRFHIQHFGRIIAEGHSAGGVALMNISQSSNEKLVDKYIFLDSSYADWAEKCYKNTHGAQLEIYTKKGSSTDIHSKELEGKDRVIIHQVETRHGEMNQYLGGKM